MALTDTFVKQVKWAGINKAGDKHSDGGGMHLLVKPTGGKLWRMDYRFAGKQRTLSIGTYPEVTIAKARKRREEAREMLADGKDPNEAKREAKMAGVIAAANTFEHVALEYHGVKAEGWSQKYADKWLSGMKTYLFTALGNRPISTITAPDLLGVLRLVEKRGILETAHTLKQNAGQVFRYGIQTGRCERNPAADVTGALKPVTTKHMAALLEPKRVGELLRAIDAYTGQPTTRVALALSALLFQRPGNIRQIEWAWVDLDKAMMTIPASEMKRSVHGKVNGRPHFVPLAKQAVELFRELQPLTGGRAYVFPSLRTGSRPMSNMTINGALRRMGFTGDEMSAHGFRAMARTLIAEQLLGIAPDVIEAQLAHGKRGPLGMAYDRAEYIAQRQQMMQRWADYLDQLRQGVHGMAIRSQRRLQISQ